MATIGSWWVSSHESRADETVLGSFYVNYLRPEGRPLGGKLYLTDQRLLFSPHFLDSIFGGEKFGIDLEGVERVTRVEAGGEGDAEDAVRGGNTDRLAIECADGMAYSFVVSDLEAAVDDIRAESEKHAEQRSG